MNFILSKKKKNVNINFKKCFWEKHNTKSIVWSSASKPQGNSLKKKKKLNKYSNNPKNDRYLNIQNIN